MSRKIAVLGAGSWGTALAQVATQNGHEISIWDKDKEVLQAIASTGENPKYHPGIRLSPKIRAEFELATTVRGADLVVLVVPSIAVPETIEQALPFLKKDAILVCAAKGIESEQLITLSQAARKFLGPERTDRYYTVLSGPTFAYEVIRSLPTAVTLAGRNPDVLSVVRDTLHTPTFRVYTTDDVIGVEIAGALKNVIAIVAGVSDGLGFGHNARAGLMTRGLVEIARIGTALGAHPLTFSGLAGLGDLVLTCTGDLSRNRRVGLGMAQGKPLKTILREIAQVAEGIRTAKSAHLLAKKLNLDVPIFTETYLALYEGKPPLQAVEDLLKRAPEFERDETA